MPVLNAMLQPGRWVFLPPSRKGGPTRKQRSDLFVQHLFDKDEVRRVWVGVIPEVNSLVSEAVMRQARQARQADAQDETWTGLGMQMVESFGPQKMPFPSLWIEFVLGDGEGWWEQMATCVMETDYGYGVAFFRLLPDGNVSTPDLVCQVDISPQGVVEDIRAAWAMDDAKDDWVGDEDSIAVLKMAMPVMWAIGLMNCRNVHTVEVTPEPRRTKKQRRPRKAGVSYHTIVLPAVGRSGGRLDPAMGDPLNQPLHKVRGHFKTYTADAPLLGKHVGTYWWGHQVRGSRENGEVVSDYRMTS